MNHDETPHLLPKASAHPGVGAVLLIAAATALQAWLILVVWGQGRAPILGDDGPAYHTLALNLLDHGAFSLATSAPFEPTVFRSPGYPAFLALIYALSGRSFWALRGVQFVLLGATAWLLFRLAARFVPRAGALWAALLAVLLWPMAFLPAFHLTETLSTFGCVLWVLLLVRAFDPRETEPARSRLAFWLGVTSGVAALVRPSLSLLVLVPLAAWTLSRAPWRAKLKVVALTVVGCALCVGPWLARNFAVCQKPIAIAAASGISLDVSARQYAGELSYGLPPLEWRQIIVREQMQRREQVARAIAKQGTWPGLPTGIAPSVARELAEDQLYNRDAKARFRHLSMRRILSSVPTRAAYFWSNNDAAPWSPGNRIVHGLLAAAVLIGVWLSRRTLRQHWPLWVVPLYLTAIHLVFHVESRYSFPARPFLLIYIGLTLAVAVSRLQGIMPGKWPALAPRNR